MAALHPRVGSESRVRSMACVQATCLTRETLAGSFESSVGSSPRETKAPFETMRQSRHRQPGLGSVANLGGAPREALTQSPTLPRFVQVAHPRITDKRLCNALALRCRGIVIPASVPSRPGRSARVLSPLVGTLLGHIKARR